MKNNGILCLLPRKSVNKGRFQKRVLKWCLKHQLILALFIMVFKILVKTPTSIFQEPILVFNPPQFVHENENWIMMFINAIDGVCSTKADS